MAPEQPEALPTASAGRSRRYSRISKDRLSWNRTSTPETAWRNRSDSQTHDGRRSIATTGYIVQYASDCIFALSGTPIVHEDY
jgi:hypothetical protein